MTPEERAEAVRRYGYREPIGVENWRVAGSIVVITLSLLGFGTFGLLFGSDAGERIRGALMVAVGSGPAIWSWRFFQRPVAPKKDSDFERELRYRRRDDTGGGS